VGEASLFCVMSRAIDTIRPRNPMAEHHLVPKLKEEIATGQVAVVAGTGISITASGDAQIDGFRVARWDGLLRHGIQRCQHLGTMSEAEAAPLEPLIALGSPDYLVMVAELITARMRERSPGTYRAWLQETVGKPAPAHADTLHALVGLGGILATLSYDPLIEHATRRQPVTWTRPDPVQEMLLGKKPNAVLHLHGYYDEPDSVVLGLASYAKVVADTHTKAVMQLLTMDRTLVFVEAFEVLLLVVPRIISLRIGSTLIV
jgi:SIR2-like domain